MRTKNTPPPIPVQVNCVHCQKRAIRRMKKRISNGAYQVIDVCLNCGQNARGNNIYIPHLQAGFPLEEIPLWQDLIQDSPPCYVCKRREGTELHHFAPRHIFEDAEDWPKEYLCKDCHARWHIALAAHIQAGDCYYCKGLATKGQIHA